jgi:ABC-type metal ion transport system substrate-binding protein
MKIFTTPSAIAVRKALAAYSIPFISCRKTGKSISVVVKPCDSERAVTLLNDLGLCHTWGKIVCRAKSVGENQKHIEYSGIFLPA